MTTYIIGDTFDKGVRIGLARKKTKSYFGYEIETALNPRFDLRDYGHWAKDIHDSDFAWGPQMSFGHLQLGLAIIAYAASDELALSTHAKFAKKVCTALQPSWVLPLGKVHLILQKLTGELHCELTSQPE